MPAAVPHEDLEARVARIAASEGSLGALLEAVLREMARDGLRGGTIALLDDTDALYVAAAEGDMDPVVRSVRLPLGAGIMGRVAEEGRPCLVEDIDAPGAPAAAFRDLGSNSRIRSLAAVPLVSEGRVVGVLEVDSNEPGRFAHADVAVLERIAAAVAGAVRQAGDLHRADRVVHRRVEELAFLLDLAQALGGTIEVGRIVDGLLDAAGRVGGGPALERLGAAVLVVDDSGADLAVRAAGSTLRQRLHGDAAQAAVAALQRRDGVIPPALEPLSRSGTPLMAEMSAHGRFFGLVVREASGDDHLAGRLLAGVADLGALALTGAYAADAERRRAERHRRAAERAAEIERVKTELLLLASHELRGPLAVARGYAEMLGAGDLEEAAARQAQATLEAKIGEMVALVDRMLDTARLDQGEIQLGTAPLEVATLVDLVLEGLDEEPRGRVRTSIGPNLVVEGDGERLRDVLASLVSNALKYSAPDAPVDIEAVAEGDDIQISVHDRGPGIAPEEATRLFTRFGRIVTPENSHVPGSGLGLYVARRVARLHGGDVTLRSTPGAGSVFSLTLPALRD